MLLLIVAAYVGWWSIISGALVWLLGSAVALLGAIGLFLRKRWGQYLWYAIALAASVLWIASVIRVAVSGWPYDDLTDSVVSLIPGVLLVTVCVLGSIAVSRHFRGTNAL